MIVDSAVYRKGVRVPVDCHVHDYDALKAAAAEGEHDFVWVGLYEPGHDELAEIADAFGLHPLAVEDAVVAHQRPKLELYEGNLFLTVKTLWYVDEDDAVETGEINLFVGDDFVITVRHGRGSQLKDARHDLEAKQSVLSHGPSAVVYAVCDTVVDGYLAVLEELQIDVDEVEASVFSPERTNDSERIYTLKRELSEVRRAVLPLKEPMRRFSVGAVPGILPDAGPFFRDVSDHLSIASEGIDTLDELLSAAFEAHVAAIQVQQNDDMRKISAGAALLLLPTLIAGVYGMNYDHMPELHWEYGYLWALFLMIGSAAVLWAWFKKSGWF
ncbi:magnesium and cobalt transport protein CorA [Nocardioides silvaticus]|uniref:Magnesium transport protein CorA n=1 Tax=Nocardioides silvaticus TaxID=2201891 RepID=A0A316TWC3_9ACTN|nr:magnesium/cobalt transporter CorA [Nocardioides silvaticus]PWN03886.1 magnesium and cobalt transport protein CorA [Nocardioides silvaticus]